MEQKTDTSGNDQQLADVKMREETRDEHPTIAGNLWWWWWNCLKLLMQTRIGNKYFILLTGKHQEDFIRNVLQQIPGLQTVPTVAECDGILVFCTIVSRAGTDLDAALNELNALSESKPAIFIVLHHTFDPEKIVPDSSRYVTRMNTLTVDCLFHEDEGLLKCVRNNEALEEIKQFIQLQVRRVFNLNQYTVKYLSVK